MNRVAVVVQQEESLRTLQDALMRVPDIAIVDDTDDASSIDLYILDWQSLLRMQERLRLHRTAAGQALQPCLLLTTHAGERTRAGAPWDLVDDIIGTPVDPTEVVRRVRMLLRARQLSLRAVEADNERLDLLNTVAHELRTPLAAIKGFASAILTFSDRLAPEEHDDYLREISTAVDHMSEMVGNLLDLSRLESGRLKIDRQPENLVSVLASAVVDARRRFPDRVIALESPEELPRVLADRRRMRQVASNLIENAIKYSPEGGEIEVIAASDGSSVWFAVKDSGIGIPAEHHDAVFERFFRVSSQHTREISGTGLGLAICRRIVEEHEGLIELTSAEGRGTTFTVRLRALPEQ
jgi:signal transduction histidine kinase